MPPLPSRIVLVDKTVVCAEAIAAANKKSFTLSGSLPRNIPFDDAPEEAPGPRLSHAGIPIHHPDWRARIQAGIDSAVRLQSARKLRAAHPDPSRDNGVLRFAPLIHPAAWGRCAPREFSEVYHPDRKFPSRTPAR